MSGQINELKGRLEHANQDYTSFKKRKEADNDELAYQLKET